MENIARNIATPEGMALIFMAGLTLISGLAIAISLLPNAPRRARRK